MKRYIRTSEISSISVESFIQRLKDIYHKKFPNSMCLAPLHYINNMAITLKPLLCGDVSDVGYGYFGNIADPFDIELDIEFENTSRNDITLSTNIDADYMFCVDIRCFKMDTGRMFHEQDIPEPDADACGMTEEYYRYYGNYEAVFSFWQQYVDNIYNTFMQLKKENNLPDYIERNKGLKAVVDKL